MSLIYQFQDETHLQLVTKLLRVRNEATISIPFVEPRAAPDLCRLLLPEDRSSYTVVELHVVAPSVSAYDHIFWVWLNWKKKNPTEMWQQLSFTALRNVWIKDKSQIPLCSMATYPSYTSPPAEESQ